VTRSASLTRVETGAREAPRLPLGLADLLALHLGVALLIVFLMPQVPQGINPWVIAVAGAVFVALQLYAAMIFMLRESALERSLTLQLLILFLVCVVISSLKSLHGGYGARAVIRDIGPMVLLLLALPIADAATSPRRLRTLKNSLLTGSLAVALITLVHMGANFPLSRLLAPNVAVRRYIIENVEMVFMPLYLGGFAVAVSQAKYGASRRARRFALWVLPLMVFAAFLSTTRSLYLGMTMILLAPLVLRPGLSPIRAWPRLAIVALVCSAGLIVLFQSNSAVFFRQTSLESPSVQKRFAETRATIDAIANEPLFGRGPGYVLVTIAPEYDLNRRRTYTHNLLSYLLLHYGIVGVGLFLVLMVRVIGVHLRGLTADSDPDLVILAFASLIGLVGILAYVQFQAIYKSFSFMAYLAISLGIAGRLEASLPSNGQRKKTEE